MIESVVMERCELSQPAQQPKKYEVLRSKKNYSESQVQGHHRRINHSLSLFFFYDLLFFVYLRQLVVQRRLNRRLCNASSSSNFTVVSYVPGTPYVQYKGTGRPSPVRRP